MGDLLKLEKQATMRARERANSGQAQQIRYNQKMSLKIFQVVHTTVVVKRLQPR